MLYFNLISFFLIIGFAGVLALQLPGIATSARVYPAVMMVLVVACSLVIVVKEIAGRSATEPLDGRMAKILSAPWSIRLRMFSFVVVWLVYPWVLSHAGFIVATTGVISVSLWLLEIERPLVGIFVAALFSVIFSIVFATILYIPTPSGPIDQLLTQALYAIRH